MIIIDAFIPYTIDENNPKMTTKEAPMTKITIQLLQTPQIFLDGQPISFPFKKAEALLYYVAVKKNITREEAAALLWAENDDAVAKKNLRNALYNVRKVMGVEPVISPQRQILMLNPQLSFDIDYDLLIQEERLELYGDGLLHGFYVKNAEEFENWLDQERMALKEWYLHKLYEAMSATSPKELGRIEELFALYMKEDPLDERIYQLMMKAYQQNGLYHKGIKTYQNLSKLLDSELRITPNQEIANLHKELLNSWTESTAAEEVAETNHVEGRAREVQYLTRAYHRLLEGAPTTTIIVGENGVGKTYLMNHFLDSLGYDSCLMLRSVCFQAEKEYLFQAWNSIMLQLDHYISQHNTDIPSRIQSTIASVFPLFGNQALPSHLPEDINVSYNYRAARNSVLKLFEIIGEHTPIILSFDNLQYMDPLSLELLSLLVRQQNPNLMILCTCLDSVKPDIQKFLMTITKERFAAQLVVKPFTREDVYAYIRKKLGEDALSQAMMDVIYEKTEGNAFFLEILLSNFQSQTPNMVVSLQTQDILMGRIVDLSKDSRQVLDLISLFHDHASLEILENILKRDTLEILDILDDLKQHGLIEERVMDGEIQFLFRHQNMQDFVYSQLSLSKRRILHQRIAAYLEQSTQLKTTAWYQRVIYHYKLCGNEPKALQYQVMKLEAYSNFNFDLYPILAANVDTSWNQNSKLADTFESLTTQLYQLSHIQSDSVDYSEIEARLLHMSGKYYISQGNYAKGVAAIDRALHSNDYVEAHPHLRIHCLRQMTFYGIQIWDTDIMEKHIMEGTQLALENNLSAEYAIECRLYGLLCSMKGEYEKAAEYLKKSIELFKSSPLKAQSYAMNIAACYNYLGEVLRKQLDYEGSLIYYEKAVDTCTSQDCPASATFYTNIARSYLAMGDTDSCLNALEVACGLYHDSSLLMGRSIAMSYYCVMLAALQRWEDARRALSDAMDCASRLSSPLETGILSSVQFVILRKYPEKFADLLGEPIEVYRDRMLENLERLPGAYEVEMFV